MLANGDKLVVTKKVAEFLDEGDIVKVIDVDENGRVSFAFGEGFIHKGLMSSLECEEHFEKITNKITSEYIEKIIMCSEIKVQTMFDKCTIVTCKLPNGFVIVESSACVSPDNYDEETGFEICLEKIKDKVWELEGYKLQEILYKGNKPNLPSNYNECSEDCNECPCDVCCGNCGECDDYEDEYDECDEEDEFDECLDTDLDCDDCTNHNCPYNTNVQC